MCTVRCQWVLLGAGVPLGAVRCWGAVRWRWVPVGAGGCQGTGGCRGADGCR